MTQANDATHSAANRTYVEERFDVDRELAGRDRDSLTPVHRILRGAA
jgi:hypothetical protein